MFERTLKSTLGIVVLAIGLLAGASAALAQLQQPPGSHVALDVPEGFKPSTNFTGFMRDEVASVVIAELPAVGYDGAKATIAANPSAVRNFDNPKPLKLKRTGDYFAYEATANLGGMPFTRVMLGFRDTTTMAMVTVNIPTEMIDAGTVKREDMIRVVESATLRSEAGDRDVGYKFGYTGPFKLAGAIFGNSQLYNLEGKLAGGPLTDAAPGFMILVPMDSQPVGDIKAFARQSLELKGRKILAIDEEKPVSRLGLDGWEQTGRISDPQFKEEVGVYAVTLSGPDRPFIRFEGVAPISKFKDYLPEFRKIAESMTLTR